MNWFLLKGLLRDRSRSLFPILVIIVGVFVTVLGHSWFKGAVGDIVDTNARLYTGHVKVMTRAYEQEADQAPNDLALLNIDSLTAQLQTNYPELTWTPRISFGGLLDIPDEQGETRTQGPTFGMAVDLLHPDSGEIDRLNLRDALVLGRLPERSNEILISNEFANKLEVDVGEEATLISSTMYGGMAMHNFRIAGTVNFGIAAMDRSAIIADITGIRAALNMDNAAGELLGFYRDGEFPQEAAQSLAAGFNAKFEHSEDEFAPTMRTLGQQNDLRTIMELMDYFSTIGVGIFVFVMSVVLWNTGLMGNLRRYGEVGVRLAIGEDKGHIYRTMISESVMVGLAGSIIGTAFGLLMGYYLQNHGLDISGMMSGSTMLMPNVMKANVTTTTWYIGFFPGVLASTIGAMFAGIGIYKRETASLFKELEVQ